MVNTFESESSRLTGDAAQTLGSPAEKPNMPVEFCQEGRYKLAIDPVSMRIVNMIGQGTLTTVKMESDGGMLIRGDVMAEPLLVRNGTLVVMETGWLKGTVEVFGDAIIDGRLGSEDPGIPFEIVVHGTLRITPKGRIFGTVACGSLQTEPGCQINCSIKMLESAH